MNRKLLKKIFACVISMSLIFGSMMQAYAASDTAGHWAEGYIARLVDQQVWSDYSDGTMKPDQAITRAEFITMINNVLRFVDKDDKTFSDIAATDPFLAEVQKATKAGYIAGYPDGTARPTASITREEGAMVIWKAFSMASGDTDVLAFDDSNAIQEYAKEAVAAMVERNIISGYPDGNFVPQGQITRAEAATIISRFAKDIFWAAGTYDGENEVYGNVIVNTSGVVLKNMVIDGDLYIAPGVAEGDVELDNVTVNGTAVISGGGENSIKIKNSVIENLLVNKQGDKPVRLVAEGKTNISNTQIAASVVLETSNLSADSVGFVSVVVIQIPASANPGAINLTLKGVFESLQIDAPVNLNLAAGQLKKLAAAEGVANVVITVTKGAAIVSIVTDSSITVNGSTIDAGEEGEVAESGEVKADGNTVVTPPSTPGNSGGGGGGGSSSVSASSVSVAPADKLMHVGYQVKLVATVSPSDTTNKTVKWTSSNPGIATVTVDGLVEAISAGSVTITAETSNGKTAKSSITVVDTSQFKNHGTHSVTINMLADLTFVVVAVNEPTESTGIRVNGIPATRQGGTNEWRCVLDGTVGIENITVVLE